MTIKQWLAKRARFEKAGKQNEFKDGTLMPVVGKWSHLCPDASKAYLFSVQSARFPGIIDQNNESVYKCGKGWRTKTSANHKLFIVSVAVCHGRKLEWLRGPSDIVKTYILPENWQWKKDELGICAVDPDGIDYHPFWRADTTIEDILQEHSANKENRIKQITARIVKEIAIKQAEKSFVLLEDSRRAGNCVEGTLTWVEQKFKLTRDEILAAPHLVKIRGDLCLRFGEKRAEDAVIQAFMRETTISI